MTSYHTVWGGTKKAAKDAVDGGDVQPDDDHREYDVPTRAKITHSEMWIACKNYGKVTARPGIYNTRTGQQQLVSHKMCQDIIQVPTRGTNGVVMCSVCERRYADKRYTEVEV